MSIRCACAGLALAVVFAPPAGAQQTGFAVGQINAGAVVGFGALHGSSISLGARLEKGVAELPDLGEALLGVQLIVDRYSYIATSAEHSYKITHTFYAAVANYHLWVEDKRWDPFVGLGLGHSDLSQKARDFGQPLPIAASVGVFFAFHAGFRYYFTPKLTAYVDAGTGSASINAGATFALR